MAFETNIKWDGRKWTSGAKQHLRPVIESSKELAIECIGAEGVESGGPTKNLFVSTWGNPFYKGQCTGSSSVRLQVPRSTVVHRKPVEIKPILAPMIGHELTHAVRAEEFANTHIAELSASEACGFLADTIVGRRLFGSRSLDLLSLVPHLNDDELVAYVNMLLDKEIGETPFQDLDDDTYADWLYPASSTEPYRLAEIVGVNAAVRLVDQSVRLGDMVRMTPDELFGQAA